MTFLEQNTEEYIAARLDEIISEKNYYYVKTTKKFVNKVSYLNFVSYAIHSYLIFTLLK